MDPLHLDSQGVEQFAEQNPSPPGVHVARSVVAVARMTARNKHCVGADLERLDDQVEIDPAGARQPNDANVGRILKPVGSRQVGSQVAAPVADIGHDLRLETVFRARRGLCARLAPVGVTHNDNISTIE